ncbi:MAG: hypothetical protein Q9M50_14340 [Methylococcales bacterium]|nr:hypothetical protein [Methylococcales bacterium]
MSTDTSILGKSGLKNRLLRQDIFSKQIERYLAGETPYLRGTLGMLNQAADVINKDPRTRPVIIYQSTWSAGGDALVVKKGIHSAKDLKGKTIVLQAYGPHVDYMMRVLNKEIQKGLAELGLVKGDVLFTKANWDYALLQTGLTNTNQKLSPKFNPAKVASVINQRQQQGALDQGELFKFEIYFAPNQKNFSIDFYKDAFEKVINLASTYGGAVITVEGHSDPMGYLRKHKAGEQALVLGQIKQSAKNLSLGRSQAVRDNIIQYASSKGVLLDASQFAIIGHGISSPKSGVCGNLPCAPKTEKDWRANMRVEFRIIQIEAEDSVFQPL